MSRTIGIIGGLGPHATVELERRILDRIVAECDQDYPTLLSFNNPHVPDRTEALLHGGESPVPALLRSAQTLIAAGAQVLCMPCNTAHAYFDQIQQSVPGSVLIHMIQEASHAACRVLPTGSRVGILCTDGTRSSHLYGAALTRSGLVPVYPSVGDQHIVMEVIYGPEGVKAGGIAKPTGQLQAVIQNFEHSVDAIMIACTELSLVKVRAAVPIIDALDTLADAVVREGV